MLNDSRFTLTNFCSLTEDGAAIDLHSAKFRDIAMMVPSAHRIVIDSSTEANLPFLANKYLGSPALVWAIMMYNGIVDPINDVYIGRTILIPSRPGIVELLEAGNRSNLSTVEL